MTHIDAYIFHKCAFCEYKTKRKYDLKRHHNAIHKEILNDNICYSFKEQNVSPIGQNVSLNGQNVSPSGPNYNLSTLLCQKCNKKYKTEKNLRNHESKCNGVDELTCCKCMLSFTTRAAKSRHIKANKCKAKSIIHARVPNFHNINTTINNIQNNNITNIQNQIIINNIGSERLDHITHEEIKRMLMSGINTIPSYIKKKHFDKNFPENNNIIYTNENKCKVMEDNKWLERDLGLLSNKLIEDNTEVLLLYFDENKVEIGKSINDSDIFDHVKDKLILIYNKQDVSKYNQVLSKIKDLIKNFKKE